MEELGYLAGGLAHDFNNLLTGILGYASFLRNSLPEGSGGRDAAEQIERSARRAAELTRRMLEWSRRGSPEPRPVEVRRLVEEAVGELSAAAAGNVEIRADLRASRDRVMADPDTLVRALIHLAANACEAMPGGGLLTISTEPFVSDGSVEFDDVPVPEGDYVSIRVTDNGRGIPPPIREKVCEPFFTTKPEEGMAGLGLPMVCRCVRRHGGFFRLESREGEGTTAQILLPIQPSTD
ncbi:MAG: ATP-binding protein [Thermodesulfobacteriota bacterium]